MITWNPDLLDEYIAPEMSKFRSAEIPELNPSWKNREDWIAVHFYNSVLGTKFTGKVQKMVIALIRRAVYSIDHYSLARENTHYHLNEENNFEKKVKSYFKAVNQWEVFCIQVQIFMDTFNKINVETNVSLKAFEEHLESPEKSLYGIANDIKHAAKNYLRSSDFEKYANPLWLNNQGINSLCNFVSFEDAFNCLCDVAELALLFIDPEKLTAKLAEP